MNYEEAMTFIHETAHFGSKLGLENIRELLARLGNPQNRQKFIHIAGTNGKGTVTRTIAQILECEGYKTGIYTSPFIYEFNERIRIGGEYISDSDLARLCEKVAEKCSEMTAEGRNHPTEFEVITAIAMLYFAEQKCDYTVLEVGLGGRLDATNVIDDPLLCVITLLGFDHMQYLGNKLSEIAYEKCGIIKNGAPVIVYPYQEAEAMRVIETEAKKRGSEMILADKPNVKKCDLQGSVFDAEGFDGLHTALIGEHMAYNIATAVSAVLELRRLGVAVSDKSIYDGVSKVRWSGRFEVICKNPLFVLDGAHNLSGIEAFVKTVEKVAKSEKKVFIMGMLADKEYEESIKKAAPLADLYIAVDVPSPRTLSAEKLGAVAKEYNKNVYIAKSVNDAVTRALKENAAIFAFGSLYMLGDVKKAFEKNKKV